MPKAISVGGINDLIVEDLIGEVQKRHLNSFNVLDLGTAEGYNIGRVRAYTEKNSIACNFTGVDIDTEVYRLPEVKNTKLIHHNLNEDFHFGNFDFITSTEVIEHVENPYHFIRNCLRNLKPSGIAFISSPNVASAYSALRIVALSAPAFFENDASLVHITPVSSLTIKKALKLIEIETGERWTFEQYFTKNIIKLPTFIPKVNHRSINLMIPGNSRLFSQVSYYKITHAK